MNLSKTSPSPARPGLPLRLVQRLMTPAALDFWARRLSPALSWQRPLARVIAREAASRDAVTLTLRPNRQWQGMQPGQHLNVSVEVDGRLLARSYSPSLLAGRRGLIAITVKRYESGRVSRQLCDAVKVGDVLPIGQAYGEMTLGAPAAQARLFLAAGSGITPLMAMIREWASAPVKAPLALGYWARHREELCFVDELRELARANPMFKLGFFLTGEASAAEYERLGRIDQQSPEGFGVPVESSQISACGPDGFVAAARKLLASRAAEFRCESFSPPPPSATTGVARITLAQRGQTVEVPRGQPLLGALEALGVSVIAGCRRGICHTCSCAKREGSSRDLRDGSESNEPSSALQLCVSAALGDLVLEL